MAWVAAAPYIAAGASALFGWLASRKKQDALDPQQQALMNEALRTQNARMQLQNPLFEMITQGAMSRQPQSARPSSYMLANLGNYGGGSAYGAGDLGGRALPPNANVTGRARRRGLNPTGQAVSALARNVQPPYVG